MFESSEIPKTTSILYPENNKEYMNNDYEVGVIGGGPAGLTTALYTTRLGHDTVVFDRGGGRCAMMADTHNVIGIPEETSGVEFLQTAQQQVKDYGADYKRRTVTGVSKIGGGEVGFAVESENDTFSAERLVIATGFSDEHPPSPSPRTGRGLHYCVHCDAYMFVDESVYVMGHGDSAAHVAMIMLNFTEDVDILLRGEEPTWSEKTEEKVQAHPIDIVEEEIVGVNNGDDGWLESLEFEDGVERNYKGGFAMYGSKYNNKLASDIGCELNDDGSVSVDDHGQTTTDGAYAVGDLTDGHNQIPVRMGQGAKAGIDIHYELRKYPRDAHEVSDTSELSIPSISDELMRKAKEHGN